MPCSTYRCDTSTLHADDSPSPISQAGIDLRPDLLCSFFDLHRELLADGHTARDGLASAAPEAANCLAQASWSIGLLIPVSICLQ